MKKYIFARPLFLTLFIALFAVCLFFSGTFRTRKAEAEEEFTEIGTVAEMLDFSDLMKTTTGVGKKYKLTADLVLTADAIAADPSLIGRSFSPIGTSSRNFEGYFDGEGHTVTIDVNVSAAGAAAGLFGYTGSSSVITGLIVRGRVQGVSSVGGIVGYAAGGRIENCVSYVETIGRNYVGDVAGTCHGAVLSCVAFGRVQGVNGFGGIVGALQGSGSSIRRSTFKGVIVSDNGTNFGGLVGSSGGALRDNYVIPEFMGDLNVSYGSVVGHLESINNGVSYCYGVSTRDAVGRNSAGSRPSTLTTCRPYDVLSGSIAFSTADAFSVCLAGIGYGYYPCPSYMLNASLTAFDGAYAAMASDFTAPLFASGDGTELSPFSVTNADQWRLFAANTHIYNYAGKYVSVAADLSLGETIAVGSVTVPFAGTVDGNDHVISFTNVSSDENSGLFVSLAGANLHDLRLGGTVVGGRNVGILAGQVQGAGTVVTSVKVNAGSVIDGNENVGGLIGMVESAGGLAMTDCSTTSIVITGRSSCVGGIVGLLQGTSVLSGVCSDGRINCPTSGTRNIGGIFGKATGDGLTLTELHNATVVNASGSTDVGGIGGYFAGGIVNGVASTASVTGRYDVGGLFGAVYADTTLTDCAVIGRITGGNFLGGMVGKCLSGVTLTVTDGYCVTDFVKDRSVQLTVPFEAFCIASPDFAETDEVAGAYEFNRQTEVFTLTSDLTAQAGKKYYREGSALAIANVYYNSDVYTGSHHSGATAKSTVVLSDGSLSGFSQPSEWKAVLVGLTTGYYPIPDFCLTDTPFEVDYFAAGDGSEESPACIGTEQQLRNFGEICNRYSSRATNKSFLITADIALKRDFFTISVFQGIFDGGSHVVSGVNITDDGLKTGFFGTAYGELRNISFEGGALNSTDASALAVGGLVGENHADIYRCYVSYKIVVASSTAVVGGLIGDNHGDVEASFFAGSISGGSIVGGVVGVDNGNIVSSCFSTGTLHATNVLGGVVGRMLTGGVLQYSTTNAVLYLEGTASTDAVGGLIGSLVGSTSLLSACLSNARLFYSGEAMRGGLVAELSGAAIDTTTNKKSYYNVDLASGLPDASSIRIGTDGIIETDAGRNERALVIDGFDRTLSKYNDVYDAYYAFRPQAITEWRNLAYANVSRLDYYSLRAAEIPFWSWDYEREEPRGGEDNPYRISTPAELSVLSATTVFYPYSGKYFVLTNDLDMTSEAFFYPIGFYRDVNFGYYFNGKIDGCGHTISNLTIDFDVYRGVADLGETDNKYVALFGHTGSDFLLKRLVMDDSCSVIGGQYVASFVGYFHGVIEECRSSATLIPSDMLFVSLDAASYQPGLYYVYSEGNYVLATGAFSGSEKYYEAIVPRAGGFICDMVGSSGRIVGCVFDGTLPNIENAYGFTGFSADVTVDLDLSDSWYLTSDTSYVSELSYGNVLKDYSSVENGGSVTVENAWDGNGFGFRLASSLSLFHPFVYNVNDVTLTRPAGDLYRLTSSARTEYSVRFCQQVTFTVTGGAGILTAVGDKAVSGNYYYYQGQTGSVTYTWIASGYYLENSVRVNGVTTTFGDALQNGSDDEMVYTFVMGVTGAETYEIVVGVAEANDSIVAIDGGDAVFSVDTFTTPYDGTAKSVDAVYGAGYGGRVVYVNNATSISVEEMIDAGEYLVRVNLYRTADPSVLIGRRETTYVIEKKTIALSPSADVSYLGVKEYDGSAASEREIASDLFEGVLARDVFTVTVRVTWDSATAGENKSYSLDDFRSSSANYQFGAYHVDLTGGTITKKTITVLVDDPETRIYGENEYSVYTVSYVGRKPLPSVSTAYPVAISWNLDTLLYEDGTTETVVGRTAYHVGLYVAVPYLSVEDGVNYLLATPDDRPYCAEVVKRTVTSVTYVYSTLTYTGEDLSDHVSVYFTGVGDDVSHQSVNFAYYGRVAVTEESFGGELYVQNGAGNGFVPATVYNERTNYYVRKELKNAGTYYLAVSSISGDYDLVVPIREIVVQKQEPSIGLTYRLFVGENELTTGDSVDYGTDVEIRFTDALSLEEGYDALYDIEFLYLYGGDVECVRVGEKWYLRPKAYGNNIVFRLFSYNATNYRNRTESGSFTLTILPITLYVGITKPVQIYGDVLDFTPIYYTSPAMTDFIPSKDIDGLTEAEISTGTTVAKNVGSYDLFCNNISASGYVFDKNVMPKLTIAPRPIYAYVPSDLSNTKVYGEQDGVISYRLYDDADHTEQLLTLPNGDEIVLGGALGRKAGEDVGSYDINGGSLIDPEENDNYVVSFLTGGGRFIIMYRDLMLKVKDGQGKYFGDADQTYELDVEEGYSMYGRDLIDSFLLGDKPIIVITRDEGEAVGSYAFHVEVDYNEARKGNYNLLGVTEGAIFVISRVRPTIEFEFNDPVYYGDSTDNVSFASARARIGNTVVQGTFSWTYRAFTSMEFYSIDLNFTPKDSQNVYSATKTIKVYPQKRRVYPVFEGDISYTYTGSAQNAVTVTLLNTVEGNNSYSLRTQVAGDNVNVTESGFYVGVSLESNFYELDPDAALSVHCTIAPAVLQVKVSNVTVDYGEEYTPTITYTGFVNGETKSVLLREAELDELPTECGVYTLLAHGASARNYTFKYAGGLISIMNLSVENDGISVEGSFLDVTVQAFPQTSGTKAFEDARDSFDKALGASTFHPLNYQMTTFVGVLFTGPMEDNGIYTYTIELGAPIETGAILYLKNDDGSVSTLDEYETENGSITFRAGKIAGIAVYEEKDTLSKLKGYLPFVYIFGGILSVIILIGIIAYFKKAGKGKNHYRAERATYKAFVHRK